MSDSSYERDRFFIVFRLPLGNDCINLNDPLSGLFFALSTLPCGQSFLLYVWNTDSSFGSLFIFSYNFVAKFPSGVSLCSVLSKKRQ